MEVTKSLLNEMVSTKMPFGQYENTLLCNLPVSYLEAFHAIGFPNGRLGLMLQTLYELKKNGAEEVVQRFKAKVWGIC
jgi:uncharacterized protein